MKFLVDAQLVRSAVFKFAGSPTRHIRCEVLDAIPLQERTSIDIVRAFSECPEGQIGLPCGANALHAHE